MEKQLKGYLPYQNKDYKKIWENGLIVVDTNVILNFYKYSDTTRKELWKILENLKDRLWMPYQVGFEYCKNRETVIENVQNSLTKIEGEIDKQLRIAKNKLQEVDKKDIRCKEQIIEAIDKTNKEIDDMLENEKKQQENFMKKDVVLEKVLELFNGKCGENEPNEVLEKIKKEAKRREENKIPPGYKDRKKEENFGDYYIFYSMIEKAKKEKRAVIFITDDEKEDWYLRKDGMILSGRPELLQEFYIETKELFFICNTQTFVKDYSKYCNKEQTPKMVIEEIEDIRKKEKLESNELYFGKSNINHIMAKRDEKSELIDKIISMKIILRRMIRKDENLDYLILRVESIAKKIISDMRYEKYHGKILIVIDELEKSENIIESVYTCIRVLNQIIEQIRNT